MDDAPNWRQRFVEWIAKLLRVPLYTWPYVIVIDKRDVDEALRGAGPADGEVRH